MCGDGFQLLLAAHHQFSFLGSRSTSGFLSESTTSITRPGFSVSSPFDPSFLISEGYLSPLV
jgi:hypothetical protein